MGFLEDYKKGSKSAKVKTSIDFIIKDLLDQNKTGMNKQTSLTGMNMEQSAPTNFVPCMFYVMMYHNASWKMDNKKVFYDVCPLIMCTSATSTAVHGFNFNFLEAPARAAVLDILTDQYKGYFNEAEKTPDRIVVNEKLASGLGSKAGIDLFSKAVAGMLRIDMSQCYRVYDRKNIIKSRMIEIDMWDVIPYFESTDTVRGINLQELRKKSIYK